MKLKKTSLWNMCRRARYTTAATMVILAITLGTVTAQTSPPITLLALGDSLTAGYGLAKEDAFPVRLEAALKDRNKNVSVINAGVSGDTSAGGRARLDWALADNPDGVIVELGGNDALRGLTPNQMYDNLAAILTTLRDKNVPALLAGMQAPPNLGPDYAREFDMVFERLADEFDVVYYPFFLDGVAAERNLNLDDGIHPNAAGVGVIVERIMPSVDALIDRIVKQRTTG